MFSAVAKCQHRHAEPGLMAELSCTAYVFTMSLPCPYHVLTMCLPSCDLLVTVVVNAMQVGRLASLLCSWALASLSGPPGSSPPSMSMAASATSDTEIWLPQYLVIRKHKI